MTRVIRILFMFFSMGLTLVYMFIIWKLTFGHLVDVYVERKETVAELEQLKAQKETGTEEISTFKESLLGTQERVKHYLGYRVLDQMRLEGHFHHIDFEMSPDQRSYCNKCHGDMPHDKVKELRAFWNMHAFFLACQTCHVRFEDPANRPDYRWYDRETGGIVASPVGTTRPGYYGAKIVPLERVGGKLARVDSEERIAFVQEFLKAEPGLQEFQKSKAVKLIHHVVSKNPYLCEDCHQKGGGILPLKALGYPEERIASIESSEVVGMIEKYRVFYLPKFVTPGE